MSCLGFRIWDNRGLPNRCLPIVTRSSPSTPSSTASNTGPSRSTAAGLPDLRASEAAIKAQVEQILHEAKSQGATAAEVAVGEDVGLGVSVRMGELENVEFNQDRGFGITAYVGQQKGSASTSDSSPQAVAETVAKALQIAKHTQPDEYSGLADAALMPDSLPDLDLYHPWALTPDAAQEMALESEAAGLAVDGRVSNSDGAQASTQLQCRVYGNSHGFVGSYVSTRHGLSCVLIARDDAGMQRDHWYTVARASQDLEAAADVGRTAAERALQRLSPRKVPTGKYPVVFSPQMSAGLVGHVISALSGSAVYRKSSFLHDKLGQLALSEHLNIVEQPRLARQLGSASFDGDGVATWDKSFVANGVIENFLLSTYSAKRLGMQTTGNAGGVHNVTLTGTTKPIADLIGQVQNGLYVTELMGQGVNGVTGDYSRGAAGFWIENGEISYPVDEITIAGNLLQMMTNIPYIGDDLDVRGNMRTPSVLIEEMMVAGS